MGCDMIFLKLFVSAVFYFPERKKKMTKEAGISLIAKVLCVVNIVA
jgi:hypothetical protein